MSTYSAVRVELEIKRNLLNFCVAWVWDFCQLVFFYINLIFRNQGYPLIIFRLLLFLVYQFLKPLIGLGDLKYTQKCFKNFKEKNEEI